MASSLAISRAVALGITAVVVACSTTSTDSGAFSEPERHPTVDPSAPVAPQQSPDPEGGVSPAASTPCGAETAWTCTSSLGARVRCNGGATSTESCASGCVPSGEGDAFCAVPAPSWSCAHSSYGGKQYWTCEGGSIFRCQGSAPVSVACAGGCDVGSPGTDDACSAPLPPGTKPTVPVPTFKITIGGGLFAEAAVRKPIEDGLRYEIERIAKHVNVGSKKSPPFTINFIPSSDSYASGIADVTYTNVYVPPGYPLTGDNQNFVVNITLHEIGHILAHHLIAPRDNRDTCVNEGLASWIAGKYWMNAGSKPVSSLRVAARAGINAGAASATMGSCVSASDAWYKVYASYFEYLELYAPGAILAVSGAKTPKSTYTAAWSTWLMK